MFSIGGSWHLEGRVKDWVSTLRILPGVSEKHPIGHTEVDHWKTGSDDYGAGILARPSMDSYKLKTLC